MIALLCTCLFRIKGQLVCQGSNTIERGSNSPNAYPVALFRFYPKSPFFIFPYFFLFNFNFSFSPVFLPLFLPVFLITLIHQYFRLLLPRCYPVSTSLPAVATSPNTNVQEVDKLHLHHPYMQNSIWYCFLKGVNS